MALRLRNGLLALLSREMTHGYQLKLDFEAATGASSVNVGQIYSTLQRLQRDGLVERSEPTTPGPSKQTASTDTVSAASSAESKSSPSRVVWQLTESGQRSARDWLGDPDDIPLGGRSVVAGKVLMAAQIPGVDVAEVIDAHRLVIITALQALRRSGRSVDSTVIERLNGESEMAVLEAELRWLEIFEDEFRAATSDAWLHQTVTT